MPEATATPGLQSAAVPRIAPEEHGVVIWHREHLRTKDQPAVAAAADADRLLPLFIFDPAFYGRDGLACDSRIAFLHECLADLNTQYRSQTGVGLSYAHGDPITILGQLSDAGWTIVTPATPSGRYGRRRDRRAREECAVQFIDGDGLVRNAERSRKHWQNHIEQWLTATPHTWASETIAVDELSTDVSPAVIADQYSLTPRKSKVPPGGTQSAWQQLEEFVDRIQDYPGNISAPADARTGSSGLSPYLKFGCLSVRQVYQYIAANAPEGRGKEMFLSRLVWNKHYEQKLADWAGWLDKAVNPALQAFNADRHDPDRIEAWKQGQTGYPLVDASMRCLAETGWLNFRMRAMCVSFYFHVLQQPWQIGADWYHHHLIDSVASINYTQWQSQCGLVGKPTIRLYNPRKQVRDQDPDGTFIRRWVPELRPLPDTYLDQPEKTPLHVQSECGVRIGEDYPYPIVDFEAARTEFLRRFDAVLPEAAAKLGTDTIATRASLSGGHEAAMEIADQYGDKESDTTGTQASLTGFDN